MITGGDHTHHHGILAGASAGAVGVLAAFGLVLLAWHRIAGAVGAAGIVIVWAVAAAMLAAAFAFSVYAGLWLRHRVLHPEVLAGRKTVTAEVLDSEPAALPAQQAAALEPPRAVHNHFHFPDAEAAAAAVRAMRELER